MIFTSKEKPEIKEYIKANFLDVMEEILSSREDLRRGVETLARENNILSDSRQDRLRLTEIIMKRRTDLSKGVGIAANVPSILPIVGAIGTTAFTSAVEFISLVRLEIEMCLEIAYIHGKKLDYERMVEALAIIGLDYNSKEMKRLNKAALKEGIKKTARSYIKKGGLLVVEKIIARIKLDALRRGLARFVPFLGMPIAAELNYRESLSVGRMAKIYYE